MTDATTRAFARAADTLAHRGPDDEGLTVLPSVPAVLAFRRLAIIDRSGGHQPMATDDARHHLAFNGEIYNYRALRAACAAEDGAPFRTSSDTEVLLRLLAGHGLGALDQLAGMFAFAWIDAITRQVVLARDRLGVKQVYHALTPHGFFFASEPKALLALPWVHAALATERLGAYFQLRTVPGPSTLFRGIERLDAGTTIMYDAARHRVESRRWWRLPTANRPRPPEPLDVAVHRFEAALLESVRRRLVSDVPVGAFLSGGLDSTLVVAAMRRLGHRDLHTFTASFPGSRDDEAPLARAVAQRYGARHTERAIAAADLLAALPRWVELNDDLVADASSIPMFLVSQAARTAGCRVMLSGEGADELFVGYGSYRKFAALRRVGAAVPSRVLRTALYRLAARAGVIPAQDRPRAFEYFVRRGAYLGTAAVWTRAELALLLHDDALGDAAPSPLEGRTSFDDIGRHDLVTRIPDDLLIRTDRATMGASVEARVPFLDHDLVGTALALAPRHRGGVVASKVVPRVLARRWQVPWPTLLHRKIGFQLPIAQWLRGALRASVERWGQDRMVPGVRYDAVTALHQAHCGGGVDHAEVLWRFVALECWYRRWIDPVPVTVSPSRRLPATDRVAR